MRTPPLSLLLAGAALLGCGDNQPPGVATDSGPIPDAAMLDAAPIDAAPDPDAPAPTTAKINEFVVNHGGSDVSEYIEISSQLGADLSGLTLVQLDSQVGANPGNIELVFALGTANAAGLFATPFPGVAGDKVKNTSVTLVLVDGFTGAVGDDVDADNDGTIDNQPWSETLDAVGISDGGANDVFYAGGAVLPEFAVNQAVGGASRIPDGLDTDSADDWVTNDFAGSGLPCCPGAVADSGEANNTPGEFNTVEP